MIVSIEVQPFGARLFVCLNQVALNVLASSHDSSHVSLPMIFQYFKGRARLRLRVRRPDIVKGGLRKSSGRATPPPWAGLRPEPSPRPRGPGGLRTSSVRATPPLWVGLGYTAAVGRFTHVLRPGRAAVVGRTTPRPRLHRGTRTVSSVLV